MNSQSPLTTTELIAEGVRCYLPNYQPREIILDHGKGSRLWDRDGKEYIDLGAGIAVNSLGHANPDLLAALHSQAEKLWHTTNIYYTEPAILLAQELVEATFADQVFFCNSGAEANEAAIKLARKRASTSSPPEQREIITFSGSFHGRTLATVTATAQPKYHEGFEPLPAGFRYCPFNDFESVTSLFNDNVCAVLVEPIQGEGGVTPAAPGFLSHLRSLCDQHNALLIYDEVQCGMGRTGRLFAHQWEAEAQPDVMAIAKALGCGFPIGALLVAGEATQALPFGSHGSTFGGNPLATAVARVALKKINSPSLLANVLHQGERLKSGLQRLNERYSLFSEIRGRGLMIGAQLTDSHSGQAGVLTEACRQQGVLILQAGPDVLRFLPALNINQTDIDEGVDRIEVALKPFQ